MNVMLLGRGIRFGVDDGSDNPAYIAAMRSQAAAMRQAEEFGRKERATIIIKKAESGEGITEYEAQSIGFSKPEHLFRMIESGAYDTSGALVKVRNAGNGNVEKETDEGPGAAALLLPIGLAIAAYFTLK
jgi:hypothetical protein